MATSPRRVVDWAAVLRGAVVGVCLFAPISALRAVLDDDVAHFDRSGWAPLFALALFVAYGIAGWVAARAAPDAPLTNGALGAMAALVLWLPLRTVVWAVREDGRGLLGGHQPVFTAGQVFGQLVFGAALGMIGGLLAARSARMGGRGGEPAGRSRAEPLSGGLPSEERPDSTGQGAG